MKLKIEMDLDNDSFQDDDGELYVKSVQKCLDNVAYQLAFGIRSGYILDINGNECGKYRIEDDYE